MSAHTLRLWLLGLVVVAAVVSFVGTRTGSHIVSWLGFLVFLAAVCVYAIWRRAVSREHADKVFDREAKTDETRTRTDQ
jgi:uncharacterized membrane protein YfcA